jgi:hypothetical protein
VLTKWERRREVDMATKDDTQIIQVTDILQLEDIRKYKLHLGSYDGKERPLDVYAKGRWICWNEWRNPKTRKNEWNRDYIFTLINYNHKKNWLFGGIYKVIERPKDGYYKLEYIEEYKKYDGRLLLSFDNKGLRGRSFILEKYIKKMTVNQLFENKYCG